MPASRRFSSTVWLGEDMGGNRPFNARCEQDRQRKRTAHSRRKGKRQRHRAKVEGVARKDELRPHRDMEHPERTIDKPEPGRVEHRDSALDDAVAEQLEEEVHVFAIPDG